MLMPHNCISKVICCYYWMSGRSNATEAITELLMYEGNNKDPNFETWSTFIHFLLLGFMVIVYYQWIALIKIIM